MTTYTNFLSTSEGDLYCRESLDEGWSWINGVGITSIRWPEESVFTCQHCGNTVSGLATACFGCGSKNPIKENSLGKARVTIEFCPLTNAFLFNPPQYLSARYAVAGYRAIPDNWILKMDMDVLRICRRWIDGAVAREPNQDRQLLIYVEVECEIVLEVRE